MCTLKHVVLLQVAIATIPLRPTFEYDTVPKQVQHAFLRAKVTNASRYPLLEGSANVYLDQSYVTETRLASVAPQEEFSCSLGDSHLSPPPIPHTLTYTHTVHNVMPCLSTRS